MRSPVIIAALSVTLAVTLAACAGATGDASHDHYGNTYPAECPASITADASLIGRIDVVREHKSGVRGFARLGATAGRFTVGLDPSLSGWILEDTKRHEFCHVKWWLALGHPDWHARHVPNVYRAPVCPDTFHCN